MQVQAIPDTNTYQVTIKNLNREVKEVRLYGPYYGAYEDAVELASRLYPGEFSQVLAMDLDNRWQLVAVMQNINCKVETIYHK